MEDSGSVPPLDLNQVLRALENPVRREILKRLSQEPNYPFQLAKDLGLAQQQVAKHLSVMEDVGLVLSSMAQTSTGPERRIYTLSRSLSVTVDVAPHLFKEKVVFFDIEPIEEELSEHFTSFKERMDEVMDYPSTRDKIEPLAEILDDIDGEIDSLEEERKVLLHIRDAVMRAASTVLQRIDGADARRVIHSAINEHERSIERISKMLNLREDEVSEIIAKVKKALKTDYI